MFPSAVKIADSEGNSLVTSYALYRPDGSWSVMLVNRDETNPHSVRLEFDDSANKKTAYFSGPVRLATFGSEQYVWINDGLNSHADPDGPLVATTVDGGPHTTFNFPKASITVLRGNVRGLTDSGRGENGGN
ncbi:MAG: hypothetical protein DMG96_15485 [Acidobacteria bacterium]|nr:MAG: hypothetical protein DMG96_15485 [Acidobacteriota bacterium]